MLVRNIHTSRRIVSYMLLMAMLAGTVVAALFIFARLASPVSAVSADEFQPGNIISDSVFTNKSSLSVSEIQSFLSTKVPTCDTKGSQPSEMNNSGVPDYNGDGIIQRWEWGKKKYNQTEFVCLKGYREGGKSASEIIYETSQEFTINPQVLIVLLQKEQALVTDTWPLSIQYRSATGYGCPDTAPCDSDYYGLTNQVRWAARMFRAILNNSPTWYTPYELGENQIPWHPDTDRCGYSTVNIVNRATQALYNYTPYRPNQAALDAGYGTGNSCSSYGNRNFYLYFTDWFGATHDLGATATLFDVTTDKSGEQAKIGYTLTKKPKSNVVIRFGVTSTSNARIVGSNEITITPSSWNNPDTNTITVEGLNNPSAGSAVYYELKPTRISSNDSRFNGLSLAYIDTVKLTNTDSGPLGVYRLYSSVQGRHIYTSSDSEATALAAEGWSNEGVRFYACEAGASSIVRLIQPSTQETRLVIAESSQYREFIEDGYTIDETILPSSRYGSIPVYWRYDSNNNRSLYTTSTTEGLSVGFEDRGIAFWACAPDTLPVFRMYRPSVGNHFFTTSAAERNKASDRLGFRYENVGFYICQEGNVDIYRLYKSSTKNHMLTPSSSERDRAEEQHNFENEGVKFRTCSEDPRDVFRLYRASTGSHFLTVSEAERDKAVNEHGFRYEGRMFTAQ